MLTNAPLLETSFSDLTLHGRGKVRDIYQVGDDLLIVATDRISAFDYVLGSGIPDKGKVLTQLSAFWFERMGDLVRTTLSPRSGRYQRRGSLRGAFSAAAAGVRRRSMPQAGSAWQECI
jgi:phosphoribosylaminoimidazole-succinocarboxamide synthase